MEQEQEEGRRKSDLRKFTDDWCSAYKAANGEDYVFQGAKDAAAAKRLIATGATVESLISLARSAWVSGEFNAKQAASIAGFAARINDIRYELKHKTNGTPSKLPGNRDVFKAPGGYEWRRDGSGPTTADFDHLGPDADSAYESYRHDFDAWKAKLDKEDGKA